MHVDASIQPIRQSHRRIPYKVRKDVEAELEKLEKLNTIEKVNGPTPWVSQIIVVLKKYGAGVRIC